MLSVILVWFYMMVSVFLLGYGILTCLTYICPYQVRKLDGYLMCGLAGATVYAQFFSLFAPVGFAANVLLLIICLIVVVVFRKKLRTDLQMLVPKGKKTVLLILLFLLYAYGTSRGFIHYDTGLYHAQSIRWIEEYGVVKGLGNLHCRLAYNSASFALSALYSFAFLGGQSYHCAAGFFALIVAALCCEIYDMVRLKHIRTSDFVRMMGIYYLLIIYDEMISPASDYFMVLTTFYIIIRWLDLLEEDEQAIFPYAMLCVLCVFLVTVKLSGALLILLTIKPAVMLLREKRKKETALYLGLGILTALPFFIRNIILSGWLAYPFTGIDICPVDWKIPKGIADYDSREIQVWGRGYGDVTQYDMPIRKWLPAWFRGLGGMDKLFVMAALLSVIVFIFHLCYKIWRIHQSKDTLQRKRMWNRLLPESVMVICFLFWLLTSPLIRYGCVYVYMVSAFVWGNILTELLYDDNRGGIRREKIFMVYLEKVCIFGIALFLTYKAAAFVKETVSYYDNVYWVWQKDYDNYKTVSYEIDGITFYRPLTGDRVGYESFPSSPVQAGIGLRGNGIKDGFYTK